MPHPTEPSKTLWDAREDSGPFEGAFDAEFAQMYEAAQRVRAKRVGKDEVGIPALGSGSDFTPFLQRLGVCGWLAGLSTPVFKC